MFTFPLKQKHEGGNLDVWFEQITELQGIIQKHKQLIFNKDYFFPERK